MIDLGKIKQGERGTLTITWEFPDSLTAPASISGATITATMLDLDTGDVTAVSGTLTATGATTATWALSSGDSGTAGTFHVTFRADVSGTPTYTLNASLEVEENPSVTAVQNDALVGVTSAEAAWVTAGEAGGDLGTAAYVDTIDEDDMASDSATAVPTQQSVKAYVDANAGGGDVGDLTTDGLTPTNYLRVANPSGLEERTPAQVLSDIGAAATGHTHDDSEITAAASATNYTPAAATVEGHLSGIDTALGSVGGAAAWGSITGTLSNQTDLQTALNAKAAIAGQTFTGNVLVSKAASATLDATSSGGGYAYLTLNGASAVQGFNTSTLQIGEGFSTVQARKSFTVIVDDANTNTAPNILTITHTTSGTPANGMGVGLQMQAESSTSIRQIATLSAGYVTVTDASRTTYLRADALDYGGARTIWEGRTNGTAAAFAVLGATPVARQTHIADPSGGGTVDAEARTAINSILNVLEAFGFVATS